MWRLTRRTGLACLFLSCFGILFAGDLSSTRSGHSWGAAAVQRGAAAPAATAAAAARGAAAARSKAAPPKPYVKYKGHNHHYGGVSRPRSKSHFGAHHMMQQKRWPSPPAGGTYGSLPQRRVKLLKLHLRPGIVVHPCSNSGLGVGGDDAPEDLTHSSAMRAAGQGHWRCNLTRHDAIEAGSLATPPLPMESQVKNI